MLITRNPLLNLLFRNALIGLVVAAIAVTLILAFDIAHLRSLIATARDPAIPILLLVFGFVVTMCSVVMGSAIMALGRTPERPSRGTRARTVDLTTLAPAHAAAAARKA